MNPLKRYLDKRNISKNTFSKLTGITYPTIWRIYNDTTTASIGTLLQIERESKGEVTAAEFLKYYSQR